jgi:hypothetical protein
MARAWTQLAPALVSRIASQQTGLTPPPVFHGMAPTDQALPYIIITRVSEVEQQVFDDGAEVTEIAFDMAVYSAKAGATTVWTAHEGFVDEAQAAIRRWTPTLAGWDASPIRYDESPLFQVLEDAIQTVTSFSVVVERK